ncbi:MAG TPA: class I SAM-dependent methyltransferase [Verrucomicrobiae bacterium]
MNAKQHWEKVYQEKDPVTDVSWFQAHPANSLELISATGIAKNEPLIDVGGGASVLVDRLLEAAFEYVTVLDISGAAIRHAQDRLGSRAKGVTWLEADATRFEPPHQFHLWHDRAVFHFLTKAVDRRGYVRALKTAVPPGGHVILATFAPDGPVRCSGLPVVRYDAETIGAELGPEFRLLEERRESHFTPWNTEQRFRWFRFLRKPVTA